MRALSLLLLVPLLGLALLPSAAAWTDLGVCTRGDDRCGENDYACVVRGGWNAVCAAEDEPLYVLCLVVDGKVVECVVDPCGTTACW